MSWVCDQVVVSTAGRPGVVVVDPVCSEVMTERDAGSPSSVPFPDQIPTFAEAPPSERHILDAAALRRRQLASALVHGSRRSWRRRQRIWPAASVGLLLVTVVIAMFSVMAAFREQQQINQGTASIGVRAVLRD